MSLISIANATESVAEPIATTGTSLMSLLPMVLIFIIFYFFLIRPQVKRQKAVDSMIDSLKKGDQVIAGGGLYGTIVRIEDDVLYLEIAENTKIKVLKSSVTEKISKDNKLASNKSVEGAITEEKQEKTEEKNTKTSKATGSAKSTVKKSVKK